MSALINWLRSFVDPRFVDHYYCCDEDVAMCGFDLTGVPEGDEFPRTCRRCRRALKLNRRCAVPGCELGEAVVEP